MTDLDVAARIRSARRTAGLTLAEVAERLQILGHPIHSDSLSRLETGERKITVDDLGALAHVLEVEPATLCGWSVSNEQPARPLSSRVGALDNLDAAGLRALVWAVLDVADAVREAAAPPPPDVRAGADPWPARMAEWGVGTAEPSGDLDVEAPRAHPRGRS